MSMYGDPRQQARLNARNDMALQRQSMVDAQERRRNQIARLNDLAIATTHVSGVILVRGPGEATVDMGFSVVFTERPAMSFGWELPENHVPVAGAFPRASIGVLQWNRADYGENRLYYAGALLAVVSEGSISALNVHWQAYGNAFRNPIGSSAQVL